MYKMSVLKRLRTLSKHEYVSNLIWIDKYTTNKLKNVSKRKVKWLCEPIFSILREAYILAADAFNETLENSNGLWDMPEQADAIIDSLMDLQKPLFALWNIEKYETREMVYYVNQINKEIETIATTAKIDIGGRKLVIIDYKALEKAEFLKAISKLHKMVHSKIASIPGCIRESEGVKLADLADNALYFAYKANSFMPKTKQGYSIRKNGMKTAMKCLREMDAPLFGLFNLMHYSENTMKELADILKDSQKLLSGVIKSDEKLYSTLE